MYKLDRMLTQMKLAGNFDDLKGVVAGNFNHCAPVDEIKGLFDTIFDGFQIPVVFTDWFGHGAENHSFPLGANAVVDTSDGTFSITDFCKGRVE
jgi:muramoyltetrapeptide carboxypeptidase